MGIEKQGVLQSLQSYAENNKESVERILDLPALKVRAIPQNKTAIVVGGSENWMAMLMMMLGENLADAVICGANSEELNPNMIMRTGLSVNSGEGGVLFICSDDKQEKENFLYADSLLDEVDIRCKVAFSRHNPIGARTDEESYLIGSEFFMVKIASAAAASGKSLSEIYQLARETRNYSNGICASLEDGKTLRNVVEQMLFCLLSETRIRKGDIVCVCMSSFGNFPYAGLCAASGYLRQILRNKGIQIHDIVLVPTADWAERNGLGIALLWTNESLREYYDAPCRARFFQKQIFTEQ